MTNRSQSVRALVADDFPRRDLDELASLGIEVLYLPQVSAEELPSRMGDANIVIVRSTRVTREAIESGGRLALIVRAGAGYDTIDVAAASERGIFVSNCPGKNSVAVAELAMGFVVSLDRRIADATADLRAGRWDKKKYGQAAGLKGRTLGIAGFGKIGRELAKRARAFEMQVLCWSRSLTLEEAQGSGVERYEALSEMLAVVDAVSVHLPLTPSTRRLFDKTLLAHLRPGAIFVNTSRGGIVDEAALADAMRVQGLRVGLDVFDPQPTEGFGPFATAVAGAGTFVGTPHIGASTEQAQNAIAKEAVRICAEYLRTGSVPNVVNIERHAPAECQLIVRHYDKVGVLAAVLDVLRRHEANVEDMTNTIFQGAKTAVARIVLSKTPSDEAIAQIAGLEGSVIGVEMKRA